MKTDPTPYGSNPALDDLYEDLIVIENRETDAIMFGRHDLLPEIRKSMLPIKAKINAVEGMVIYEEASKIVLEEKLNYLERELNGLDNENPRRAALESDFRLVRGALFATAILN